MLALDARRLLPAHQLPIQLAVIRKQVTDLAHRIGSLITNPGGPGGSGVEFIKQNYPAQPSHFSPQLLANCSAPTTPPEVHAVVSGDNAFDAGCQTHSGIMLPYVGTPNAARDMDMLRAALGDRKMYYLGASYGTYLGAVYAELFETHIARAVLDGPMPPNLTARQLDLGQAGGFQDELTRFIADCATHSDCPLGSDATTAEQKLADFFASTQTHPLPTDTNRTVDEALAETGVLNTLYGSPTSWPLLRRATDPGDGR